MALKTRLSLTVKERDVIIKLEYFVVMVRQMGKIQNAKAFAAAVSLLTAESVIFMMRELRQYICSLFGFFCFLKLFFRPKH